MVAYGTPNPCGEGSNPSIPANIGVSHSDFIILRGGVILKNRTSKVWSYTREEFQKIVSSSTSYLDCLSKMNLNEGSYKVIKERIKLENIDITNILLNNKKRKYNREKHDLIPLSKILIENSTYANRSSLKKRLILEGVLEYKCAECGNTGEWNGKPLALQLEHKNGINNDHRLENLCFLCPNCHSQTKTYAGKNKYGGLR